MFLYQTVPKCFLTSQRPKKHFPNTRCAQLTVVGTCDVIHKCKFINYSPEVMLRFRRIMEILTGQKNGVGAFGHNSAERTDLDEIWNHVSQMLGGLALADFGGDPRSSDSLRGSRNFF